jgi:hypothetical protein
VKVDAVLSLDDLEAIGKAVYANILVAIVECLTVRLRKFGIAGLFAPGTPKNSNPMVVGCHPGNMRLRRTRSSQISVSYSNCRIAQIRSPVCQQLWRRSADRRRVNSGMGPSLLRLARVWGTLRRAPGFPFAQTTGVKSTIVFSLTVDGSASPDCSICVRFDRSGCSGSGVPCPIKAHPAPVGKSPHRLGWEHVRATAARGVDKVVHCWGCLIDTGLILAILSK